MFRLYKQKATAQYVSEKCKWGYTTVKKVIIDHRFKERLAMIQNAALQIVDTNQAQMLAEDLMELTNIQSMITEYIQTNPEMGFTVADLERVMKLRYHLMGMPDLTVETKNTTIEVVQVARSDVIDAEFEETNQAVVKKPFES